MKKYYSTAEVAKLIRQVLKEAFPTIKFSVRSKTYSGGSSIDIGYTDGPAPSQVEALVKKFQGKYFCGMTDYEGFEYSALDGVEVTFGVSYIFVSRKKSVAFMTSVVAKVSAKYGFGDLIQVKTGSGGEGYVGFISTTPELEKRGFGSYQIERLIYQEVSDTSLVVALDSPTAARVTSLGDDGYGYGATGRIQPAAA